MVPRVHVDQALQQGLVLALPPSASRHVQVLRLQPGAPLILFDGLSGQWQALVDAMDRKTVQVRVQAHEPVERELTCAVTLAVGMPANERMDALIEKAAELGVAAIQPLVTTRSVLRVAGERADRKAQHWQAVAVAACEQSGRNRVPNIASPMPLATWWRQPLAADATRLLLSLDPTAPPLLAVLAKLPRPGLAAAASHGPQTNRPAFCLLSGPEGGLAPDEAEEAEALGWSPVSLGSRTLRADTAPLAALATIACWSEATAADAAKA